MSFWIVPASWSCGDALLLGRDDVAGQHRQHGAVHGHRYGHLVERDAVEQDLHVLDESIATPGLADVAHHARMIGIVAAVGGEIERHRQAHLAGREVGAIELLLSSAVEKPAYWRTVQGRPAYIVAFGPR